MSDQIFSLGHKVTDNFCGTAYVNLLVSDSSQVFNCTVYDVRFEPMARNYWHSHPGGQILLCTDGEGYYQERGRKARKLIKGDVVEIQPETEHWHGAGKIHHFSHLGISPNMSKGPALWLEPVTEAEYSEATSQS